MLMFYKNRNNTNDNNSNDMSKRQELKKEINKTAEKIEPIRFTENQKREKIDSLKLEILEKLEKDNRRFQENLKVREYLVDQKLKGIDKELEEVLEQGDIEKMKEVLSKLV